MIPNLLSVSRALVLQIKCHSVLILFPVFIVVCRALQGVEGGGTFGPRKVPGEIWTGQPWTQHRRPTGDHTVHSQWHFYVPQVQIVLWQSVSTGNRWYNRKWARFVSVPFISRLYCLIWWHYCHRGEVFFVTWTWSGCVSKGTKLKLQRRLQTNPIKLLCLH